MKKVICHCWWFRKPGDHPLIWRISHFSLGFSTIPGGWEWGFQPSTVCCCQLGLLPPNTAFAGQSLSDSNLTRCHKRSGKVDILNFQVEKSVHQKKTKTAMRLLDVWFLKNVGCLIWLGSVGWHLDVNNTLWKFCFWYVFQGPNTFSANHFSKVY